MPIRKSVTRDELTAALKPLCDLLGTSPKNFYDSPGMKIADGEIVFVVPVQHDEDAAGRAPGTRAGSATALPPHPQGLAGEPAIEVGDTPEFSELGYVVRVEVESL